MSKLTALQQAMRIVEQYAPQLFDTYNANGRAFIDEMTKLLDVEREQIITAFCKGYDHDGDNYDWAEVQYYNETYKGGEQ